MRSLAALASLALIARLLLLQAAPLIRSSQILVELAR